MFDPYLQWLEIPPERRPPTRYDLLGLPPYESDAATIHKAAMQRLTIVRRYQLGEHAEIVVRLLGELSAAFDCLSDPEQQRAYDEQLRTTENDRHLPPPTPAVLPAASPSVSQRKRPRSRLVLPGAYRWMSAAAIVAVAVATAAWFQMRPPAATVQTSELVAGGRRSGGASVVSDSKVEPAPEPAQTGVEVPRPVGSQPTPNAASTIRYFGYATQGPRNVIAEISPYTNVVFVRDWIEHPGGVIGAARRDGLPTILCMQGKEMVEAADHLTKTLDVFRDSVLAVCWMNASFSYKVQDIAGAGRRLKGAYPKVQFWLAEIDKPGRSSGLESVPRVVDALVIMNIVDTTPAEVHATADACLADWKAKAAGRPLIWYWLPGNPLRKEGVVPETRPGTLRACMEVAQRHELAGLIFDRYGKPEGQERIPIDSRPELVEEIRQMSRELGLEGKSGKPRPDRAN